MDKTITVINSDDTINNDELLQKVASAVKTWVSIDDELKALNKTAKDLRSTKSQLEDNILTFMQKYKHETIDITNGKLKRTVSQSVKPIKEELILNTLTEYIKDPSQAQIITDLIKSKRETTEKVNLRRLNNSRTKKN